MACLLIALEGLYYLLSGRRGQARDSFSAIAWNFSHFGEIRRRNRNLRQIRQRTEREVRSLQIGGSAAISNFSRGQFTSGQDRFSGFLGAVRSSFQGEDSGSLRDATVLAVGVALLLTFGKDPDFYLEVATHMGGIPHPLGDAAAQFMAFPLVPVTHVLWRGDEEFDPDASILFDVTIPGHLPTEDIAALAGASVAFFSGVESTIYIE